MSVEVKTLPHPDEPPDIPGGQNRMEYLPALFLALALAFPAMGNGSGYVTELSIIFISIVLEAIPFMFVGSLVGGLIETFVSREYMASRLPKNGWLTVCIAAAGGLVFPVCECAVVPVVRRLLGKGLPFSAAIAYLLGGPIVNPIVAGSTALAYGLNWPVVVLRIGMGYGLAVFIGLVMGRLFKNNPAVKNSVSVSPGIPATTMFPMASDHACHDANCGCDHTIAADAGWDDKVGAAIVHAMDDFLAVGHYLVIGAFIAALAQTYIGRSSILGMTSSPVLMVVLMMILAILLNLCSEADAFIAASFRGLIPIPAQMAFMLTGPMFDLKLLLMYQSLFTRRAIITLSTLIIAAVFAASMVLDLFWGIIS